MEELDLILWMVVRMVAYGRGLYNVDHSLFNNITDKFCQEWVVAMLATSHFVMHAGNLLGLLGQTL